MIHAVYDAYAPIYDAIGQDRFGAQMARLTLAYINGRCLGVAQTLDLACGTGAATLVFAEAGHAVSGLDRSGAMLAIARAKARDLGYNIDFVQGDIRDLSTWDSIDDCCRWKAESFDLITCFYNSLNYLTQDGDLERAFDGVARLMRPAGYLIFDLNSPAEFATWDEQSVVTYDSGDFLVYNQLRFDARSHLATGRIVWFVRGTDQWYRGEETHIERSWTDVEVAVALRRAGLVLETRLTPKGEPAGADAPCVVYVAHKGKV